MEQMNPDHLYDRKKSAPVGFNRRIPGVIFLKESFDAHRQGWILGLLLIGSFLLCYAQAIRALVRFWWNNDTYSYGFVIPWISLYLVWVRRKRLTAIPVLPNPLWGLPICLGGIVLLVLGKAGGINVLQELSLLVTLLGIVLLLLGHRILRSIWFPLAYLFLMVPVWDFALDRLHLPFQMFSAALGTEMMHWMAVPSFRQGNLIELPNVSIEVAKACSGVNYLIAVVALGIPAAYYFLEGWGPRVLLVSFAVLIAALGNSVRVALIGLLSYHGIGGNIHGPFHILQGLSVSIVGYAALFSGLSVLSRGHGRMRAVEEEPRHLSAARLERSQEVSPSLIFTLLILLTGAGVYSVYGLSSTNPPDLSISAFPIQLGPWKGRDVPSAFPIFRDLGADQEISRKYETPAGEAVTLYIGYFEHQDQDKKMTSYKSEGLDEGAIKIRLEYPRGSLAVNQSIQRVGSHRMLVLTWYEVDGRMMANRYLAKAYTAWEALTRRKSDGAVIILATDLDSESALPSALKAAHSFFRESIFPLQNLLSPM